MQQKTWIEQPFSKFYRKCFMYMQLNILSLMLWTPHAHNYSYTIGVYVNANEITFHNRPNDSTSHFDSTFYPY